MKNPRIVSLKRFLRMLIYESAFQWHDLIDPCSERETDLVKNCICNVVEYSLRQFYRDYVGKEYHGNLEGSLSRGIGFPAWIEFEDGKPTKSTVKAVVNKLIETLVRDAGANHVLVLQKGKVEHA